MVAPGEFADGLGGTGREKELLAPVAHVHHGARFELAAQHQQRERCAVDARAQAELVQGHHARQVIETGVAHARCGRVNLFAGRQTESLRNDRSGGPE